MIVPGELPWGRPTLMQLLAAVLKEQDWLDDAACHDKPEDWFFPKRYDGRSARRAKDVCDACPVRADCLDWGMETDDGIFGGLTPLERAAMRRQEAA